MIPPTLPGRRKKRWRSIPIRIFQSSILPITEAPKENQLDCDEETSYAGGCPSNESHN